MYFSNSSLIRNQMLSFSNLKIVILFIFYSMYLYFSFSFFSVPIPFLTRCYTASFVLFVILLYHINLFTFFVCKQFFTRLQTFLIRFDPLLCVRRHALFICKFTSPCSMFACLFFLTVLIWFPSVVLQHFSKIGKWVWDDQHGLPPFVYDTATLVLWVDQLLCHCVFIYSNIHWRFVSFLRDGSLYCFCLLAESCETINNKPIIKNYYDEYQKYSLPASVLATWLIFLFLLNHNRSFRYFYWQYQHYCWQSNSDHTHDWAVAGFHAGTTLIATIVFDSTNKSYTNKRKLATKIGMKLKEVTCKIYFLTFH